MTTWKRESTYNIKYVHFVCKYSSNPYIHKKFSPRESKHERNIGRTLLLWRLQSHNIILMLLGCWPLGWGPCDNVQWVL